LRGFLASRPRAVAALTKIFLDEIERLLCAAAGVTRDAATTAYVRPRLGGISFLHRFGSALNHHVHLHACVTDGVFVPPAAEAGCDGPPAFLPARPFTPADLAALAERVRRRGRLLRRESKASLARHVSDYLGQAHGPGAGTADWEAVCADARKTPPRRVRGVSRNPLRTPGPLLPRLTSRSSAGRPLRKCN
jgi:hypothetical protein